MFQLRLGGQSLEVLRRVEIHLLLGRNLLHNLAERGVVVLSSLIHNQVVAQSESGGSFGLDKGNVYFV